MPVLTVKIWHQRPFEVRVNGREPSPLIEASVLHAIRGEGANLTAEAIQEALGYAPATPASVASAQAAAVAAQSDIDTHVADTANPHAVTKAQLGLASVDNTADVDKPVSTAQAAADAQILADAMAYTDASVTGLYDLRGNYDASSGSFPSAGGSGAAGAIAKGDLFRISVAGVLGGVGYQAGDAIVALVDAPGQTAGNWMDHDRNFDGVPEPAQAAASQAEAEAGSGTSIRSWTPQRIWQAIAAKLGLGDWISGATDKATPVDADSLPLSDSAASNALKKLTWANIKATLSATATWLAPGALSQAGATTGQGMVWNGTTWAPATISASPAGSSAELQYRNGSAFGAAAGTYWDATNGRLSIGAGSSPSALLHLIPDSAAEVVLVNEATTSQTADLHQYKDSAGVTQSKVRADGRPVARRYYLDDSTAPSTPTYIEASADGYSISFYSRYSSTAALTLQQGQVKAPYGRAFMFGADYCPIITRNLPLASLPASVTINADNTTAVAGYPWVIHGTYGGAYTNAQSAARRNGCDLVYWAGWGAQSPTSGENGGNGGKHRFFVNVGGAGNGAGVAGSDGEFEISQWDNAAKESLKKLLRVFYNGHHFMANVASAPSDTPSAGGYFYVESGALKYKGSAGTVTTIATA